MFPTTVILAAMALAAKPVCSSDPAEHGFTPKAARVEGAYNVVSLADDGGYIWNGTPLTQAQLVEFLGITQNFMPVPTLVVEVDADDDCDRMARMFALVENRIDCDDGRCQLAVR